MDTSNGYEFGYESSLGTSLDTSNGYEFGYEFGYE